MTEDGRTYEGQTAFDFDAIDRGLKTYAARAPDASASIAAQDAIARLLAYVCHAGDAKKSAHKFIAFVYVLRPDLLGGLPIRSISQQLEIPRTNFEREVSRARKSLKFDGILREPNRSSARKNRSKT
jgi:hypothetical protein